MSDAVGSVGRWIDAWMKMIRRTQNYQSVGFRLAMTEQPGEIGWKAGASPATHPTCRRHNGLSRWDRNGPGRGSSGTAAAGRHPLNDGDHP